MVLPHILEGVAAHRPHALAVHLHVVDLIPVVGGDAEGLVLAPAHPHTAVRADIAATARVGLDIVPPHTAGAAGGTGAVVVVLVIPLRSQSDRLCHVVRIAHAGVSVIPALKGVAGAAGGGKVDLYTAADFVSEIIRLAVVEVQGNSILFFGRLGVHRSHRIAGLGCSDGILHAGVVAIGGFGVGGALQLSLDAVRQIFLLNGIRKVTAGNRDSTICGRIGPRCATRLNSAEGAVALDYQLVRLCIWTIVHDFAVNSAGIALIKRDTGRGIVAKLANIKSNNIITGGNHIRIALEGDIAVVEAQSVILIRHLVFRIDVHILQGQIGVVLNDALNIICALGNADGTIFEGNGGVSQELEAIGFCTGRTSPGTDQRIGVSAKINGKVLVGGHGNANRVRNVLQNIDGLAIAHHFDRLGHGVIGLATHHNCLVAGIGDQHIVHIAVDNDNRIRSSILGHAADGAVDHAHSTVGTVGHLAAHGGAVGDGHVRFAAVGHVAVDFGVLGNGQLGAALVVCEDNGAVQRTAGDLNVAAVRAVHRGNHSILFPGIEGAAVDGQLTLIHAVVDITVQDSTAGGISSVKGTAVDGSDIPVQERRLRHIFKGAVIDGQLTVVIVLDGVQAAGEGTAVDGKDRILITFILVAVIPTILDHAGEMAGLCDGNAIVDLHGAVVHDIVIGISAAIHIALSVFLATGIRASVKHHRTAGFILNCRFAVGHIVHSAVAGDGQRAVVGNGIAAYIGQSFAVQIQDQLCFLGDYNVLVGVFQ